MILSEMIQQMHDTMPNKPDHADLFNIAAGQQGYFTSEQAREAGFSRDLLSYHASTGRFIRVQRGLYRFRDYPSSPNEKVMAAWLTTGKDNAVVSHESALELLNLSGAISNSVHLTVPRSRRYLRSTKGTTIHTTNRPLPREDITIRDGIRITSPVRTILDAAEAGTAPEQIEMAVAQALEWGLTTSTQLRDAASQRSQRVTHLVNRAIRWHSQ
jgi:predicted transcriptional regulator of viral defense system